MNPRALGAEAIGTFMLVFSILAVALGGMAPVPLSVAISVGITVMALAYSIGHISGGHYNPAVTLGLVAAGRFDTGRALGYIIAQCVGALVAAAFLALLFSMKGGPTNLGNFGSNGYDAASPGKFNMMAVFLAEAVLTAFFVVVIVGATSKRAPAGFAPIAIGLTLGAIHIMAIPISNCSVNPARSLAAAVFGGSQALSQLWVFWVAPIVGGIIGGVIGRWLQED